MNGRELAMTNVIICHNSRKPGHKIYKMKDCKQLMEKSYKSSNMEDDTRKWCSYHQSNGHSNEDCYQ